MLVSIYAKAPSKPIESLSVTRLDVSFIRGDPEWIEKLDQLLSLLPNIKRLFIDTCVIHIDFNELSRILKQRLLHLRFFKCEIHAIAFPVLIYKELRFSSVKILFNAKYFRLVLI
ncbi:unnamed protein product [Rotaria sp. Silwood1]|nr:unnamed protein product [Rotaria sp. Silwood1]